jgi:hypothetical protein
LERHGAVDWGGGAVDWGGGATRCVVKYVVCCQRDSGIRDYIAVANDDSI